MGAYTDVDSNGHSLPITRTWIGFSPSLEGVHRRNGVYKWRVFFFNLPTMGLGPDERLARCAIRLSTQAFVVFLFRKER